MSHLLSLSSVSGNEPEKVLVHIGQYDPANMVRTFQVLLDDIDCRDAVTILGIGRMRMLRRKLMLREFRALYIGLWRLALTRSCPHDHETVFQIFLEQEAVRWKKPREREAFIRQIRQYVDKLGEHGDADFSEVSRHLLSLMEFDESRTKALILKLALHLRRIYTTFFTHLL